MAKVQGPLTKKFGSEYRSTGPGGCDASKTRDFDASLIRRGDSLDTGRFFPDFKPPRGGDTPHQFSPDNTGVRPRSRAMHQKPRARYSSPRIGVEVSGNVTLVSIFFPDGTVQGTFQLSFLILIPWR